MQFPTAETAIKIRSVVPLPARSSSPQAEACATAAHPFWTARRSSGPYWRGWVATAILRYLTSTKIGEKGQLTVPKEFRKDLGLEAGAPFAVLRLGDGLILLPEQQRFERLCERISSALAGSGVEPGAVLATLPEARRRVFARHYGAEGSSKTAARRRTGRRRRG